MIRVEILGPSGEVASSVSRPGPVVVGSAPGSDVRLSDPDAADRHVQLSRSGEGEILVRDLGSDGGTRVGALVIREASVPSGTEIRIGSVILRVSLGAAATAPVATAGGEGKGTGGLDPGNASRPGPSVGVAWGLFAAMIAVVILQQYLTVYSSERVREVATVGLGIAAVALIWAGLWSLGNRVFGHPFNFARHLGTMSLWFLAFTPAWWAADVLHEIVHTGIAGALAWWVGIGSAVVLLFLHIRVASRWRGRVNALVTLGIAGGIWAMALLADDSTTAGPIESELTVLKAIPEWLYHTRPAATLSGDAERLADRLSNMEAPRSSTRSAPGH